MLETRILRAYPQIDHTLYSREDDLIQLCHELEKMQLREDFNERVRTSTVITVYDQASQFASLYRDRFVCTDCEARVFYVFRDFRWQQDKGYKYLTEAMVDYNPDYGNSMHKRNHFINDVALHAYVETFQDRLSDFQSVHMGDVSFDIHTGILRPGLPLDYTSVTTRCSLKVWRRKDPPAGNNWTLAHVDSFPVIVPDYRAEVEAMLRNIFPDDSVYRYFMRYAGSMLIPGNRDKIFMVWSGTGNNGKSVLARFLELTLGEYAVKLPTSLITGKRTSSSAATPELMLLDCKLVAFLQEPAPDERLNVGIVKELTGNDTIYGRGLYEKGRNINMKAKVVYTVNSTDNIAGIEEAVWNRIVVLPFETHFTDLPRGNNDRARDPDLIGKLPDYAGSFLGMMIEEARAYLKEGLVKCERVDNITKEVKLDNDYIQQYFSVSDMDHSYTGFVAFMREFNAGITPPSLAMYKKKAKSLDEQD